MTKKHYILISNVIKTEYEKAKGNQSAEYAIATIARNLCVELSKDNTLFNRERFLEECGLTK